MVVKGGRYIELLCREAGWLQRIGAYSAEFKEKGEGVDGKNHDRLERILFHSKRARILIKK